MMTRRELLALLGSMSAGSVLATDRNGVVESLVRVADRGIDSPRQGDSAPKLAAGAPSSPERTALIDAFRRKSEGIENQFEARAHKGDWTMPYRLFRSKANGALPLVMYLHGSGGLGTDNVKQMGLGNVFGTRVWALPENQERFPCHVVVPQTDRGWVRYGDPAPGDSVARPVPGLGDGARVAFDIVDALRRELSIDDRHIYLTGQSMGGAGVWHMLAQRPKFFAAAAVCCGSESVDDPAAVARTPLWNFHGVADTTVPVSVSRERIAAMRKAGGHPIATEYAGVGHNVWQWAYTEPELVRWMFAKRLRR
jgi:predicted peptidase